MYRSSLILALALLSACAGASDEGKETGAPDDTAPPLVDADGDGVPEGTDCNDADEYSYPGAREIPYDGRDQDCDGADVVDVDGDGHDGDAVGGDDCNDANPDVYPGAPVICEDLINEDCSDFWDQYDCDEDGYQDIDDCGREDPAIHPGAADSWYDGVDQDCDGRDDYDQDEDGFRSANDPDTTGAVGDDCDDLDAAVNPDADETWNATDDDCDGAPDVLTNRDANNWWYGDSAGGEAAFGSDISAVGDLDGDGRQDLVVGVVGHNGYVGRAYVVPTGEGLDVAGETAFATIDGTSYLGASVASLQGPGGGLVVVGEPGISSVHVFDSAALTGGAALTTADAAVTITSSAYYIGGDVAAWADGDGGEGLLVGSYEVADAGTLVALFPGGSLTGALSTDTDALWTWSNTGDTYDAAVVGDLDGDGIDEVGIATSSFSGTARAYLAAGSLVAEGGADTDSATLTGFSSHLLLTGVTDLDGDGYGELAVSDWQADGGGTAAGKVWLVGGAAAMAGGAIDEISRATISGVTSSGGLRAAASTGDFDGDGTPDVMVCAPGDGASSIDGACSWVSGATLAGGGDHAPGTTGPTFTSKTADDLFGTEALPFDVDFDGDDDLLVGAPGGTAGALYLYDQE